MNTTQSTGTAHEQIQTPTDKNTRLDYREVVDSFCGKEFTRRNTTYTVIDVTLGGDLVIRESGKPRKFMHQSLFMDWLNEDKSHTANP